MSGPPEAKIILRRRPIPLEETESYPYESVDALWWRHWNPLGKTKCYPPWRDSGGSQVAAFDDKKRATARAGTTHRVVDRFCTKNLQQLGTDLSPSLYIAIAGVETKINIHSWKEAGQPLDIISACTRMYLERNRQHFWKGKNAG